MNDEEIWRKLKKLEDAEIWRIIPSSQNYEVSNQGRIRRITKAGRGGASYIGKILKTPLGGKKRNRPVVNLNGTCTKVVSHLVAEAFLGVRPFNCDVHHKDHDVANDWLYNLEYIDHKDHGQLHGSNRY